MARKLRIGLIVFPLKSPDYECGQSFLTQFIQIITPLSERVTVITGNYFPENIPSNVELVEVKAPKVKSYKESATSKIYRLVLAQFTVSLKLIQMSKKIDTILLFFGSGLIFLPTLVAWIQRKKIIVVTTGSFSQSTRAQYKPLLGSIFYSVMWLIEQFNYGLASRITVGSENMIRDLHINKYQKKVLSNKVTTYLDTDVFKIKRSLLERDNIIGYVGRLCAEKGVIEFAKAIPLILSKKDDIKFLIVGDGPLMDDMKKYMGQSSCLDKVVFTGWVPYNKIPYCINIMKFHILPSYTEALGGANLEAMACGAISIANNVGGLPDVVIDGETGFLLEDNSPQSIANKVVEILGYSETELEIMQRKANEFVEENFTYERVVESWRQVLCESFKIETKVLK